MSIFTTEILEEKGQTFSPRARTSEKYNCSTHMFIAPDGSVSEAVRLNILDDRHREEVIGYHFCQQYAKFRYFDCEENPQFYVVGRDNPWDFEYVLHDARTFNLEICRIAEHALFEAMKSENDVSLLLRKDTLKGFEIRKIERLFPGTLPRELVKETESRAAKRRVFQNPSKGLGIKFFLRRPIDPDVDLVAAIREAVSKKASKPHSGKERTILIIDNITTHASPSDFYSAAATLTDFLEEAPFPSIWIYTGYYSDSDGHDAEYSLLPLKLSTSEIEGIEKFASAVS